MSHNVRQSARTNRFATSRRGQRGGKVCRFLEDRPGSGAISRGIRCAPQFRRRASARGDERDGTDRAGGHVRRGYRSAGTDTPRLSDSAITGLHDDRHSATEPENTDRNLQNKAAELGRSDERGVRSESHPRRVVYRDRSVVTGDARPSPRCQTRATIAAESASSGFVAKDVARAQASNLLGWPHHQGLPLHEPNR